MRLTLLLCTTLLLVAYSFCLKDNNVEKKTAELMEQVLAAVSGRIRHKDEESDNVMKQLCVLVNELQESVIKNERDDVQDNEFAIEALKVEYSQALHNLTLKKVEYNSTIASLNAFRQIYSPLPAKLADLLATQASLQNQRAMLFKECVEDKQGQELRIGAVNTDLKILEEVFQHLSTLSNLSPLSEQTSLLEVSEKITRERCLIPNIEGPVVRCQNGFMVPISEENGTISTIPPGNGMEYSPDLQCAFRISPNNLNPLDRIELKFLALDTVKDIHFIKIYDGPEAIESKLIASFSGESVPPTVTSKDSNEMTIVFDKQRISSERSYGFAATFSTIRIPTDFNSSINLCPSMNGVPLILTGKGGFISEESHPNFADALQNRAGSAYSHPLNCKWLIQAMPGETIEVHYMKLNTEEMMDFVTMYDGPSIASRIISHESGVISSSQNVFSSTNSIFVSYNADYSVSGKGFALSWCIVGTPCPELKAVALPSPLPLPTPSASTIYNITAPQPVASPSPNPNILIPPKYPNPLSINPIEGTCCPSDCHGHGICSPVSCKCSCFTGFTGEACADLPVMMAHHSSVLLDLGSGVGDDDSDNTVQKVRPLNLDPFKGLLEKLKFELFQSLTYEHDATNATRIQCDNEMKQQDEDLKELSNLVLSLKHNISELNITISKLVQERNSVKLGLDRAQNVVSELDQKITDKKNSKAIRQSDIEQQLRTFQSIRDIITQVGAVQCSSETQKGISLVESAGSECIGELLDTQLQTHTSSECIPLCGFGCAGFSFRSDQGCRFYSSITSHSNSCAVTNSTALVNQDQISCSCFQKS